MAALLIDKYECQPNESPCLYNIEEDPCETRNLAAIYPSIVTDLMNQIKSYELAIPNNRKKDMRSDPSRWNNTWIPWLDYV